MQVPDSFTIRLIHGSLNELGFGSVADQLIAEVQKKGVFIEGTNDSLVQSSKKVKLYQWFTDLISDGLFGDILELLDSNISSKTEEVTEDVDGKPNLCLIFNIGLESVTKSDLVPVMLIMKYLIKRTIFLQKLVNFLLNLSPSLKVTNNSLIQYLGDELSPVLDLVDFKNQYVEKLFDPSITMSLTRESESSKLLSLVMQLPLSDSQIENLIFNREVMFTLVSILETTHDYFINKLRKTLVKHFFKHLFISDFYEGVFPYLNFKLPPQFMNNIIEKSVLYSEERSPYYLPSRSTPEPEFMPPVDDYINSKCKSNFPSTLLKTLTGHSSEVWACKFSPLGNYLVTGAADGKLIIYDVKRNFEIIETLVSDNNMDRQSFVNSTYKPYTSSKSIIYCAWEQNEDYIVSGSLDTRVRVWCVKGIKNRDRKAFKRATRSSGDSSDEIKLTSCFILGEKIRTWSCEFLPTKADETPQFIIASPDKVLKAYDINGYELYDFYSNPSVEYKDDVLMKEDDEDLEDAVHLDHTGSANEEEFEVETSHVRTIRSRSMSQIDTRDYSFPGHGYLPDIQSKNNFNRVNDICITPNGKILISANDNKQVAFYSIPNFKNVESSTRKLCTLKLVGRLTSCAVSNDGKYLLLSLSPDELQVWNIEDLQHDRKPFLYKKLIGHKHVSYMIRSSFGYNFNGEEQLAVSGGDDGDICIWKLNTGRLITRINGHENVCNSVTWNNNYKINDEFNDYGKLWCSVGDDKLVKIWGPANFYN